MANQNQKDRLKSLSTLPRLAGIDHRNLGGKLSFEARLASMPRKERRKIEKESRRIDELYKKMISRISSRVVGQHVDLFLRELMEEYNGRYMGSGYYNQPVSFNYFEPFGDVKVFRGTVAPYVSMLPELHHLFGVNDFFDYLTSNYSDGFELNSLLSIPEKEVAHFSVNGDLKDHTFIGGNGGEFLVSGFSMVRRGNFLYWYLLGGEVLSTERWEELCAQREGLENLKTPAHKTRFIEEASHINGAGFGAPTSLSGYDHVHKKIIAGETELSSGKHLGLCIMRDFENSFHVICDDPEIVNDKVYDEVRDELITQMHHALELDGPLIGLAEACFQLPAYFAYKLPVDDLPNYSKSLLRKPKLGVAGSVQYVSVPSVELKNEDSPVVRKFVPPHYSMERDGHWRKLELGKVGAGPSGETVEGRTWVKKKSEWRKREKNVPVYVKSTIESSKLKVERIIEKVESESLNKNISPCVGGGELYILRCAAMLENIYKVGFTSGDSYQRATELSAATGVPEAFFVVKRWSHSNPKNLETVVHAALQPYRYNDAREFFQTDFEKIVKIVEREICKVS